MLRCPPATTLAALAALWISGCAASPDGPTAIGIAAGEYAAAFDAAAEVAWEEGLAPALRDARAGIIETDPARTPSLLEPWRWSGESSRELRGSTLGHQRRRARFEFTPVTAARSADDTTATATATTATATATATTSTADDARRADQAPAPDLLGSRGRETDLTATGEPLELRVWVFVEREQQPGTRPSTWTRTASSRAILEAGNGAREDGSGPFWVAVARDPIAERRLLAAVRRKLADDGSP